jgi:DNA-binding response OmpR family regulator
MAEFRILVVDDDPAVSGPMEAALAGAGYLTRTAQSQSEALAGAEEFKPDLILMDVSLGDSGDGIDTAQRVNAREETPIIYVTAHDDEETFARALATAPFAFIEKPVRIPKLLRTIGMALGQRQHGRAKKAAVTAALINEFTPLFDSVAFGTFAPDQAACTIFELQYYSLIATRYSKGVADHALLKLATMLKDFFCQEVEKNISCKASFYRATKPRIAVVIEGGPAALAEMPSVIQHFMTSRKSELLDVTSSGAAMVSMSASSTMLSGSDPAVWLDELRRKQEKVETRWERGAKWKDGWGS